MKAVVWVEKGKIEIQERPVPARRPDEVLIRVKSTGICGSDITIINGKHPRAKAPLILGHEFMGIVEEIGPGGDGTLKAGDRVVVEPLLSCGVCRPCLRGNEHVCEHLRLLGVETDGAFTRYVSVPRKRVYPLPDRVPDEAGAIVEPMAVAIHSVTAGTPEADDTVVIVGAGPIGIMAAETAAALGVRKVCLFEVNPFRISLAESLGLTVFDSREHDMVETAMSYTEGKGADILIDAAGISALVDSFIPMTAIKGRIMMTALHKVPAPLLFRELSYKEISIIGTRIYARGDYETALELLRTGRMDIRPLVTHTFPMSEAVSAFDTAMTDPEACKIVINQE